MRSSNRNDHDGGFLASLTVAGGVMLSIGVYQDNPPLTALGGILVAPTVIKYSIGIGGRLYDCIRNNHRERRLKKYGRNLERRYLAGKNLEEEL